MTASLAKLSAGNGYDYLTRQVACADATRPTSQSLSDYYTEKGERPGVWIGRGLPGLEGAPGVPGVVAGEQVTEAQMAALFGEGLHPNADQRIESYVRGRVEDGHTSEAEIAKSYATAKRSVALGQVFREYESDTRSTFLVEVTRAYQRYNEHPEERAQYGATPAERGEDSAAGLPEGKRPRSSPVPEQVRRQIRTQIGRRTFRDLYGRAPLDARELAAHIAKESRPRRQAVSGYDVTFSPVKSVSALWAIAPREVSEQIERAHDRAVREAIAWAEEHVIYTRRGANGVASTDVNGVLATAFTHRDSRAGDPDLHTHVAISAKVQDATDGAWRALDGQVLYKAMVSISERYNSLLEEHLSTDLGLAFAERSTTSRDPKRAVREVVGMPAPLLESWSSRKRDIDARSAELVGDFLTTHGRPPTPKEALELRQQANLETREGKHEPRSLAEQRATWRRQAVDLLGSQDDVDHVVQETLNSRSTTRGVTLSDQQIQDLAAQVLVTMENARARFQAPHVIAEAERRVRGLNVTPHQARASVDRVVAAVLAPGSSIRIDAPPDVSDPAPFRRADGTSVYEKPLSQLFTTQRMLAAEDRIVEAARQAGGGAVPAEVLAAALLQDEAVSGRPLNQAQRELVHEMATSGRFLQLAFAPAGSGKTTSMRVLATAWQDAGGTVIGLAPSAVAAAELRDSIECPTDTLAKLVWHLDGKPGTVPAWMETVDANSLILVDEAGMAGTLDLDKMISWARARGAAVRLIGDDQQLSSVASGGVLRDVAREVGALSLSELVRFKDPAEAAATLQLRNGDPEALGFYLDRGRVAAVPEAGMADAVYTAWREDTRKGRTALMLAYSNDVVNDLNGRARADRIGEGRVDTRRSVVLRAGLEASAGDVVVTRRNDRRLRLTRTDFVKNGDRWVVTKAHRDGALTVRHDGLGRTITLPKDYVADHVDLGYASTIHGAQGQTVQASHVLMYGSESRQLLYVGMSRGQLTNQVYVPSGTDGDEHQRIFEKATMPATVVETLEGIITRDDGQVSARSERLVQASPQYLLARAAEQYEDSLGRAALITVGEHARAALAAGAEQMLPGLTSEPAWDTLAGHLATLSLRDGDPLETLAEAIGARELGTSRDRAAVLDWRLDSTQHHSAGDGPLPWLPGLLPALRHDTTLGDALTGREAAVAQHAGALRDQVLATAAADLPAWAVDLAEHPRLLTDVAVWRAAHRIPDEDTSLLGPAPFDAARRRHYEALHERISHALGQHNDALGSQWREQITEHSTWVVSDPWWPVLAERLDSAALGGAPVAAHLTAALADGPLPDDHAAAALWSRIGPRLSTVVAVDQVQGLRRLRPPWTDHLLQVMPEGAGGAVVSSAQWSTLVAAVNQVSHDLAMPATDVITRAVGTLELDPADPAQPRIPRHAIAAVLAWRVSDLATEPPVEPDELHPEAVPVEAIRDADLEDFTNRWAAEHHSPAPPAPADRDETAPGPVWEEPVDESLVPPEEHDLAAVDGVEEFAAALAARDYGLEAAAPAAPAHEAAPVSNDPLPGTATPRSRVLELNAAAAAWFTDRYPGSPAQAHFSERFGTDLTDTPYLVGYAPAGYRTTTEHLRRVCGATDEELIDAGLAHRARNGNMIDDFRDRAVVAIRSTDGEVVGFIGRDLSLDDRTRDARRDSGEWAPPKYSNTRSTAAFTKGAHVFGLYEALQASDGAPARLAVGEGTPDAIALTLSGDGVVYGVSPMGTAMRPAQADLIAAHSRTGTVWLANDNDTAGQAATAQQHLMLSDRGLTTRDFGVPLPAKDPAEAWSTDREKFQLRAAGPEHHSLAATAVAASIIDQHRDRLLDPASAAQATAATQDALAPYIAATPVQDWDEVITWVSNYWPYDTPTARDQNAAWDRMTLHDRVLRDAINWEIPRPIGGVQRPQHPDRVDERNPDQVAARIGDLASAVSAGKGFTVLPEDELRDALVMLEEAADNLEAATNTTRDHTSQQRQRLHAPQTDAPGESSSRDDRYEPRHDDPHRSRDRGLDGPTR